MSGPRFSLEQGEWYGLTMFPGYFDYPYHSPIRVDAIELIGQRRFRLRFLNLAYAAGVQDFCKDLRTHRRTKSHIVAEDVEVDERTYVFVAFTRDWLKAHFPDLNGERFFDLNGRADSQTLLKLAASI